MVGQTFLSVRIREWGHSCPRADSNRLDRDKNVPGTRRFATDKDVCPTGFSPAKRDIQH